MKQVVKNSELPSAPQIDKKYFEVNMAFSKILDGFDVSSIDVSSPKFLEDLEKMMNEETKMYENKKD